MRAIKPALVCLLVSTVLLAGCAGSKGGGGGGGAIDAPGDVPDIEATSTTGGIHGFVVDDRIVPIKGATITVTPGNHTMTTNAEGAFAVSGLEAGTYFVKASHPLYNTIQKSTDVVAGVDDPPDVKIQLTRLISATPYFQTLKFEGYIVCSVNTQGVLSEECGEGVGVQCVMPPIPCGRVGHNPDNHIQWDISVDVGISSMVLEQVWEPTSDAGGELYTPVGTNWVCDPTCAWDSVTELHGASPTRAYVSPDMIAKSKIGPGVNVTMFTWAGSFDDPAGVALNQRFTDFATNSYYLPLPETWSFVNGDAPPF